MSAPLRYGDTVRVGFAYDVATKAYTRPDDMTGVCGTFWRLVSEDIAEFYVSGTGIVWTHPDRLSRVAVRGDDGSFTYIPPTCK